MGDEFEIVGYSDILEDTARAGIVPEDLEVKGRQVHLAPASILWLCEIVTVQSLLVETKMKAEMLIHHMKIELCKWELILG
eukprot:5481050-Ditylum_brightwellii.AAC.1